MAYNSDGYIMIDFSMVDFRKTNQTIDGLFERCKNVIGTNKFVIVINANNKTPLPSTVSITNGQYVIESVLYTFSISSADNLHITKKTTPEELIDDDHVTLKTTFSSNKIMSLIEGVAIKSFKYIGNGENVNNITFPDTPNVILGLIGAYGPSGGINFIANPILWGITLYIIERPVYPNTQAGINAPAGWAAPLSFNGNTLTINGESPVLTLNVNNIEYTVFYI